MNLLEEKFKEKTGKPFATIYKIGFPKLKSFLNNMIRDEEEAKDITNEAFMKALTIIDTFEPEKANISTWIFHIAKNMLYQRMNKKSKSKTSSLENEDLDMYRSEEFVADNYTDNVTRENNLVEKVDLVKIAISELPQRNAEVINMRQFKNMSYQDIADFYQKDILKPATSEEMMKHLGEHLKFTYKGIVYTEVCLIEIIEDYIVFDWNQERMNKWEESLLMGTNNYFEVVNDIKVGEKTILIPFNEIEDLAIVVPLSTIKSQIRQSRLWIAEKCAAKFEVIDAKSFYD